MKPHAFVILAAGCAALAGCGGGFSRIMSDVPDWFDARRSEIRGEGYPQIRTVPKVLAQSEMSQTLSTARSEGAAARATFLADPRSAQSPLSPVEIESAADGLRSDLALRDPGEGDFMSDEEIEEARAMFADREAPR